MSLGDIKARNFNLDVKNPHVGKQEIQDPVVLLAQYESLQQKIDSLRQELKAVLGQALQRGQ